MKKIFVIFCIAILSQPYLFSQELKDVGAGVINYLLSSPKSVNRMNPDQQVALGIIGNLLKTAQERKHEINVAQAGRTEINLSANTGQQVQLVMDSNGSVFALSNGIIYPISNNVVEEAQNYVTNQQPGYMDYVKNNSTPNNELMLPNYDIAELKREWDKEKTLSFQGVKANKEPFYISDILDIFELEEQDLFIYQARYKKYYPLLENENVKQTYLTKGHKLFVLPDHFVMTTSAFVGNMNNLYLAVRMVDTHIRGTFTAKWVNDLNGNGTLEFDEFTDIRRNFYANEPFVIAAGLSSQYSYKIKITILNQISGEVVFSDLIDNSNKKANGGWFKFNSNTFKPGIYAYHISFIRSKTGEELEKITDEFQILAINQREKAGNAENPTINTNPSESSSKTKMINDLIQLLKEGKISEETFKASMKAIENK